MRGLTEEEKRVSMAGTRRTRWVSGPDGDGSRRAGCPDHVPAPSRTKGKEMGGTTSESRRTSWPSGAYFLISLKKYFVNLGSESAMDPLMVQTSHAGSSGSWAQDVLDDDDGFVDIHVLLPPVGHTNYPGDLSRHHALYNSLHPSVSGTSNGIQVG
jgi:hypothetical protein